MFDRNIVFGFLAGLVVGAIGTKLYADNKDEIDNKIKSLKDLTLSGQAAAANEDVAAEGSDEITLEELETQKEKLEDLIAEQKDKIAKAAETQEQAQA